MAKLDHPIRTRVLREGDRLVLKILIAHEMESGFRKDEQGVLVPPWYIHTVQISLGKTTLFLAHWGPAISKNPFLELALKDIPQGTALTLIWQDTAGDTGQSEILVTV